jgi:hypothetical protein
MVNPTRRRDADRPFSSFEEQRKFEYNGPIGNFDVDTPLRGAKQPDQLFVLLIFLSVGTRV